MKLHCRERHYIVGSEITSWGVKLHCRERNYVMGSEKERNYNMGAKLHYGSEIERKYIMGAKSHHWE